MNLSETFIRRPIMTTLVMVAILLIGLISFFNLPVAALPSVDYPTIQVSATLPGASPETMASSVAAPLEKQFMSIQGIETVSSSSKMGKTEITLQFNINKNLDVAAVDVQTAISRAQGSLPANLPKPPTFRKVNPSETPIIYLVATSETLTQPQMYEYASNFIGQRISIIPGVAQVFTYGYPYALKVDINPDLIAAKGLTLSDVAAAISAAAPNLPSGKIESPLHTAIIQSEGQVTNAAEMDKVIISFKGGAPVRIEDVGKAVDSVKENIDLKYHEGNRATEAVVLAVQKQPGANTLKIAQQLKEKLPELLSQIPGSLSLEIVFDKSISIRESVYEVEITLMIALLLVVGVIYVYLGRIGDTIIPSLAMPMSIFIAFAVMRYFDFTIDNLSLLALTLANGFIVDDAIVVLENVVRRIEEGENRWKASLNGAGQISFTILSMTLSLAAVFIPLIFVHGLIGKIFFEFSVVMVTVILASGFISLTLTPMLTSLFASESAGALNGMAAFSNRLNEKMLNLYRRSLAWAMNKQRIVLAIGMLSFLTSLFLFWHLPKDFLPSDDNGFLIAYSQSAEGTSEEAMSIMQQDVIKVIKENPSVQSFVSGVEDRTGFAFIVLKPFEERKSIQAVMGELYQGFKKIPGVDVFIKSVPLINLAVGGRSAYQYTLTALETEPLFKAADAFITKLKSTPGFVGVSSDLEVNTPQIKLDILRDEASALGITPTDIENALLLSYAGGDVAKINTPFEQYSIILQVKNQYSDNVSDLESIWLRSNTTQAMVPLGSVAQWKEVTGVSSINHFSQYPSVTVSFNLAPGFPLSAALDEIKAISTETLPPDVRGESQGAANTFENSLISSAILFILSILAIYIVLGILYESFIHPLTILSSLPPAILGGLLTLWVFGLPLSLYSYLGLLLLIGIVKKNGILVVDFALDNIHAKRETAEQSIIEACLVRFRPIMMTTLAAVMGALPIAIGLGAAAEVRRPLGFVIIGGLLFSQLITLYLTPVVYLHLEYLSEKYASNRKAR